MSTSASYPFCIATIVTHKAIEAMLEGSGTGNYRDEQPWLIAQEIHALAAGAGLELPILFACTAQDGPAAFSHWSTVTNIEVLELHRGQWDSRCYFGDLVPFNPIWESIDSVFVKASQEQMDRELKEGIRVFRQALDEHHIHPYAICETPAFITEALNSKEAV